MKRPAVTVNLAINRRCEVRVSPTTDGNVHIRSLDRGDEITLPLNALRHDKLGLITRHVAHFGGGAGLSIETKSGVPSGSGLGGSSTLGVALAGALSKLSGRPFALRTVQDIETALLGLPTGYQDYVAPMHGGCNVIRPTPGGLLIDPLVDAPDFLARHLLLVDTQISHHSGMNNWEVVKRFLDGDETVVGLMNRIRICAEAMEVAVRATDLTATAAALDDEWQARRALAPIVSNERIEAILAAGKNAGALAGKVCGAGGGGCLVLLAPDTQSPVLRAAVQDAGGSILDFEVDHQGLRVDEVT